MSKAFNLILYFLFKLNICKYANNNSEKTFIMAPVVQYDLERMRII